MAHKTMVDGTAYEITGGKTMIDGTSYNISKGRTLISGTGYDINLIKYYMVDINFFGTGLAGTHTVTINGLTYMATATDIKVTPGTTIEYSIQGSSKKYNGIVITGGVSSDVKICYKSIEVKTGSVTTTAGDVEINIFRNQTDAFI